MLGLILIISIGILASLLHGSSQSSKYHYIFQSYYGPKYLPLWLIKKVSVDRSLYDLTLSNGTVDLDSDLEYDFDSKGQINLTPIGIIPEKNYSGKWTCWDRNGIVRATYNITKGKIVGLSKEFDSDGLLQLTVQPSVNMFKRYVLVQINYYSNGDKSELISLSPNCEYDGIHKLWYRNGQIKIHSIYSDEILISFIRYDKDGSLNKKEYYDKKGVFIKRELYKDNKLTETETTE